MAISPPSPTLGVRCAWCEQTLESNAQHLGGRVVCPVCGAATTEPWPSEETLERAYATWYRPATGRFAGGLDRVLARSRGRLATHVARIAPPGRILDVGAGDGALLDALHAADREAIGLERERTRPDVRDVDIAEVEGGWAAIVFWHSLEHLRSPGRAIREAAARLRDGGVLVVALPNTTSLQARVFGDRWFALDPPRHLVHLPADTLLRGLSASGLTVSHVSHFRGGQVVFGWLHGLVGALPGRHDLYDAIRRPEARRSPLSPARRAWLVTAAVALWPIAVVAAAVEIAARRGGSVYVEARRSG